MNYDHQILNKLKQGYSYVAIFRMILGGWCVNEHAELGVNHRLSVKKSAFESLFKHLLDRRFKLKTFYEEKRLMPVEKPDLLLLFFSKDQDLVLFGQKYGVSEKQLDYGCSFIEYCDAIGFLMAKYPSLGEVFDSFTYHLFLVSYHSYELIMLEDTHRINTEDKYGPVEMDYISYLKRSIRNFRKNQNAAHLSRETKELRKNEMIDLFGFSEGDLDFESQLEYLEKITELSNRKTYVLSLLRKPLNEIIKNVDSGNYSRREFYADLYSLIPFLDPKKNLYYAINIMCSDYDIYDSDVKEYKYRTAKKFFTLK